MQRKQYTITVLILGALCTIGPFSIDMYLPGFPAIARDLGTTIDQIQLSITSYLIGVAIGQVHDAARNGRAAAGGGHGAVADPRAQPAMGNHYGPGL